MPQPSNPFDYGGPVTGELFAGRHSEITAVENRLRNHIGVVVTAPRRYGKSSLVKQACLSLQQASPEPAIVSVNLLQAGSMATVASILLKGLFHVPGGPWHRLKQSIPGFLRRLQVQPSTTFDLSGRPTFSFASALAPQEASRVVEDVYRVLHEIGAKRPAVLYLDEFQAVLDLHDHLPRHLKALADEYRNVSLVLAGSRQHLMESLVISRGAPLYNMLEPISLGPIPREDWIPFLVRRARSARRPFADESVAADLWALAKPVPFDVQQLAFESFNQADAEITARSVRRAVEELIRHQAAGYAVTFEQLSPGQRRVLKALANGVPARTGSAAFASAAELANAASVSKALQALTAAELVTRREGKDEVTDPFFSAWLRLVEAPIP